MELVFGIFCLALGVGGAIEMAHIEGFQFFGGACAGALAGIGSVSVRRWLDEVY